MDTKKVALVTGANRGIGFEACRQFAKAGFMVLLTARDAQKGEQAVKELQDEGLHILFNQLDVTDADSIDRLVEFIKNEVGRVDVLVNNAAVALDKGRLLETGAATFQTTLDINVLGVFRVSKAILPIMQKQDYGRVVNISSGYGQIEVQSTGAATYKVSKLALNGLTKILAGEVDSRKIKINVMCPGWVRTDMGGAHASRSPEKATETILWLAQLDQDGPNGEFFRDKKRISW